MILAVFFVLIAHLSGRDRHPLLLFVIHEQMSQIMKYSLAL